MAHPNLDGLSLHEEEEEGFSFDFEEEGDEQVDLRWCLVGRFLCEKAFHFNSMKVRMAELWNPVKGVTIKEAPSGKLLFHFAHPLDMEAVLNGGPWTFDNNTLILEQVQLGVQVEQIPLFHINLWYMRVRVKVDVRQPLKKGTKVKNRAGEWCFVKFKYEKLGVFCFVCGIMGHTENNCEVRFSMERDDGTRDWSAEIRADPRRQGGRPSSRWLKEERGGRTEQGGGGRGEDMESQAEKKRRRQEDSPSGSVNTAVPEHFLTAAQAMEHVRVNLKFNSCLSVDVEGRSGGLSVMWRDTISCRVMNYSRNFINLIVADKGNVEWRLTCYYGYPERGRRKQAWDMLRDLRDMSYLPWCIVGDFNDLLSQADKKGFHPHPNWLCNGFRSAVSDCDLTNIYLEGYPYTWIKSGGTPYVIEERLDRAMANSKWLMNYPNAKLLNLLASHSDHSPILLQNSPMIRNGSPHSFRFENSWLKEDDIDLVVEEGWGRERGTDITFKTSRCAETLKEWGRKKRMRFKQEVLECSDEMERLTGRHDTTSAGRYREVAEKHARLLIQEETYWRQRAKMHWLKEGDLNTNFFHMSASSRQRAKKIEKLMNEDNMAVTTQPELCEVARNYFDQLFKAKTAAHDSILALMVPKITIEDNARLVAPITKEELKAALFQMHPDKSPGPDGFNPAFYQHFWELCGNDIYEAVQEWLNRGFFPSSLNETNICLIPKCENPISMKDMRPISLCNVLYKVVSKLLANRLKGCLDKCVSEEQSAFVEGRSILDNALIAIEVIHALKRRTRGRKGELALKIDISKAYDKVDWGFLRGMLERLGFANQWIQWMMLCVSSVNYSVLVNFEKAGPIFPGRGLRQGDPLSPYLFILVTEGLTALIKNYVARGDLHGIQICRGAPKVSHLLFADDCFLFCRSTLEETNQLMSILKIYEEASGQEINLTKSEVFFSRNLSVAAQEDLSRIMGVKHVLGTGSYLGLPSMIGRRKKEVFAYLKDRVWKRINSWRGRALSKAGKEIMIKSVLQAIPSYVMSIYLLPESTIKDIERMLNSYWWGGGGNNKGIRWLAWDRMTHPKAFGGMGFRDLHAFNLAMIAKQGWNIMTKPHTLVSKLYKARYFPNSSLLDSQIGHNPSYVWRGIWKARHILMHGCRWSIGNGTSIKIMSEPWLRDKGDAWIPSPQVQGVYNMTVNDLMKINVKMWNTDKIDSLFPLHIANRITDIPLFEAVEEDKWIWMDSLHGHYSVKSGYNLMLNATGRVDVSAREKGWKNLWKIQAPPKAKHLLWRICKGCLPTRNRLQERRVSCLLSCPLCDHNNENDWHILFYCNDSIQATKAAGLEQIITPYIQQCSNAGEVIREFCSTADMQTAGLFAVLLWVLWNNRNNSVWNDTREPGRSLGIKARLMWEEWNSVNQLQQRHQIADQQQQPLFVTAGTMWKEGNFSVVEGESTALLYAMQEMERQDFFHVIFETDSKSVATSEYGSSYAC
ncbi:hypothetical protein TSUD_336770 [Trifolium subterraneum]|uniref:Reverse transcriptase domain-containing protein n=1 Tax=Trifolium subterraneum TaxID=3900 RepID=A0A2Z6MVL9_TRISU|nr:hypothetical protein TSUD_336770 [Trifolium subterraneum]